MGTEIIDFKLLATDGNNYGPTDFTNKKILVLIFMCNHCPYVKETIDQMIAIQADYAKKGVQLIGINANDSSDYPEDSFEAMQEWVKEKEINFIYLHDESQEVAKAYQAQCTPDIFVFNQFRKLVYHGRIDELGDALDEILETQTVIGEQLPSMGCSIKWK